MIVKHGMPARWFDEHGWLLGHEDIEAREKDGWTYRPFQEREPDYLVPEGFEVATLRDLREGDTLLALGWNWVGRSIHDEDQRYDRVPGRDREYTVAAVKACGSDDPDDPEDTHARLNVIDPEDGELVHVTGGLPYSSPFLRKVA